MPTLDLDRSFNELELGTEKRLVDICIGVPDVPWASLKADHFFVVNNTLRYLRRLVELNLVEETTPEEMKRNPSEILHFSFRLLDVEHKEEIQKAKECARYYLGARGLGMRGRDMIPT